MKNKLILTCGAALSGKTTWSKKYVENHINVIRLCPDEFRALYGSSESDQSVNHIVFKNLLIFAENLLRNGYSVLIDATNYNKKNRQNFVDLAKKLNLSSCAYVFNTDIKTCKERNLKRERQVPEFVIDKQFAGFEPPTREEFDKVITLNEGGDVVKLEGLSDLDAENYQYFPSFTQGGFVPNQDTNQHFPVLKLEQLSGNFIHYSD